MALYGVTAIKVRNEIIFCASDHKTGETLAMAMIPDEGEFSELPAFSTCEGETPLAATDAMRQYLVRIKKGDYGQ